MGFLLKTVHHVHSPTKANGVDGAISVSVVIRYNLQYSRTRSFPWLGSGVFPAKLSDAQSGSYAVLDRLRERQQVPFGGPHPIQGPLAAGWHSH